MCATASTRIEKMISWRGGNGLAVLVLIVVFNRFVDYIAGSYFGIDAGVWDVRHSYPWLWMVGMWPSAIFCWFYGKRLATHAQAYAWTEINPATGKSVRVVPVPEIFWIPVQWCSVPCFAIGVWFWQIWGHG
jgi:hypothetical protein